MDNDSLTRLLQQVILFVESQEFQSIREACKSESSVSFLHESVFKSVEEFLINEQSAIFSPGIPTTFHKVCFGLDS